MTVYAAIGEWAANAGWLPIAVGIATALPLVPVLILAARRSSPYGKPSDAATDSSGDESAGH